MADTAKPLELAALDSATSYPISPAVFCANLEALTLEQPEFSGQLAACELPANWRPVRALDGTPTWRCEAAGAPPAWLGGTAIPARRAASRLATLDLQHRTPGLCTLGAGAELLHLLGVLPPHVPVYVFESGLHVLAAVLRLHDLSTAIRAGRCILLPPGMELATLRRLLAEHPGLEAPSEMLLPDLVHSERLIELRQIGETINLETAQAREARLQALAAGTSAAPRDSSPPRLAVLALHPDPAEHAVAQLLAEAAVQLGWPTLCHRLAGPHDAHALRLCERLAEFRPTVTIGINHPCPPLPATLVGAGYGWILVHGAAAQADPRQHYLAATPTIAVALTAAGVPAGHVQLWLWPAPATAARAAAPAATGAGVLLVGERPPVAPEACGIRQETHRILWNRVLAEVTRTWETPTILHPDKLLRSAEAACGVALRDAELRVAFLSAVRQAAIPAQVATAVVDACRAAGLKLVALGRGWEQLADHVAPLAPHLYAWEQRDSADLLGCVSLAWPDPLDPALVYAAARGWPLLIWQPGGRPLELGPLLTAPAHYEPFSSAAQLRRALESLRTASATRTARVRALVAAEHTFERRLEDLAARVRAAPRSSP